MSDLRVIRTKEAIREALIELIEEKGFEGITVKDITTRAKINRGTFYSHYQDKYDLISKCEEEMLNDITEMIIKNVPNITVGTGPLETLDTKVTPFTILVSFFEYLNQNRQLMKAILGPKGDLSFQTKLKEFMRKNLFESNKNPLIKQNKLKVPSEYFVSYVASAYIGVIQQWLNNDRDESPEEMARILSMMTIKGPFFTAGLKIDL